MFLAKDTGKRTRKDLYQGIDADYYGFRDDEDGLLAKLEEEASKKGLLPFFSPSPLWPPFPL